MTFNGSDALSSATMSKVFCSLLKRGLFQMEILPRGASNLFYSRSLFRNGLVCIKANKRAQKLSFFYKMTANLPTVSFPLNISAPALNVVLTVAR